MNSGAAVFFLLFSNGLAGQPCVTLRFAQPPELRVTASGRDTVIMEGGQLLLGTGMTVSGGGGNYLYCWSPGASLNDSLIARPMASPCSSTVYVVTVTDRNGCSFSLDYPVTVKPRPESSGTVAGSGALDCVLNPNPGSGLFRVDISGRPAQWLELSVTDSGGKLCHREKIRWFDGNQTLLLDLNLPAGIYHLSLHSPGQAAAKSFVVW